MVFKSDEKYSHLNDQRSFEKKRKRDEGKFWEYHEEIYIFSFSLGSQLLASEPDEVYHCFEIEKSNFYF